MEKQKKVVVSFPVYLIVMIVFFFFFLYFCAVLHNTPTLLPVPMQVVAKACAVSGLFLLFFCFVFSIVETPYHFVIPFIFIAQDSEETLSDECPLEEVPVSA